MVLYIQAAWSGPWNLCCFTVTCYSDMSFHTHSLALLAHFWQCLIATLTCSLRRHAAMLTYFFTNFWGITITIILSPFHLTFCVHVVGDTWMSGFLIHWDKFSLALCLSLCPHFSLSTISSTCKQFITDAAHLNREKICPDCLSAFRLFFCSHDDAAGRCMHVSACTQTRNFMNRLPPCFTHQP